MDPNDQSRGDHHLDPPKLSRPVSGLGIAVSYIRPRQQSCHGFIDNAAPTSSPSSTSDDASNARGTNSPQLSPNIVQTPGGTLRKSISTAWDRGAKRATYARLDDEADLGAGGSGDRDIDQISLDSLQMDDEDHKASRTRGPGFISSKEVDDDDYHSFKRQLAAEPPTPRTAAYEVHIKRTSYLYISLLIMSIYSTILSGIWLVVAFVEPRWHQISTNGAMALSTAELLTAIFGKTIEMTMVTVFVAFLGQVLTRRAMTVNSGMTMAELAMRSWVTQPGSLLANGRTLRYAGNTLLGIVTLIATLVAAFYTTASDTMVRPKLQLSSWKHQNLKSYIFASYSNPTYIRDTCATPVSVFYDPLSAGESCLAVQYSGDSFSDFQTFLSTWSDTSGASTNITTRPRVQSTLYDNVTMYGTWIEGQFSDVSTGYETYSRIVNNASLAMPHSGVYKAATNKSLNGILQPSDLDGQGSYNISAGVVSPAVNVMCVNMNTDELAALVYTEWPDANVTYTGVGNQTKGWTEWESDVPVATSDEWLNDTAVDDIFRWGEKYDRRPPVFQMFPADYNTILNYSVIGTNVTGADAIYILGKSGLMSNYTLCELRSWLAIQCSTHFDVSGTKGMTMNADCAQNVDYTPENATLYEDNPDAYVHYMSAGSGTATSADWKNAVQGWSLSINLNGGINNNDASNARILTELALRAPALNNTLPSMAEALAAVVANTLVTGAVDTPFVPYWDYNTTYAPGGIVPGGGGERVAFPARVRSQEYASWHTDAWQGVFYVVLAFAFLINLLVLWYFVRVGLVKDFLEPTSLFALATAGGGGGGGGGSSSRRTTVMMTMSGMTPESATGRSPETGGEKPLRAARTPMIVPYKLVYKEDADHHFFEEAEVRTGTRARASGLDDGTGRRRSRGIYSRLSGRQSWV